MKDKVVRILKIIWPWYNFPAHCYHELCHVAALIIFFPFIEKINWKDTYFRVSVKRWQIEYSCAISYRIPSWCHLIAIICCAAPIIGWFIGYVVLVVKGHWLLFYFAPGWFMYFNLSRVDKKQIKESWQIVLNNKNGK